MRTKHHWLWGEPPHRHQFTLIIPDGDFPGVYMSCETRCACGAIGPRQNVWVHS